MVLFARPFKALWLVLIVRRSYRNDRGKFCRGSISPEISVDPACNKARAAFGPLFASLFEGGSIDVERYGARFRVLGRRLVPNHAERLRVALGEKLASLDVVRPSLEEIFVGYMRRDVRPSAEAEAPR